MPVPLQLQVHHRFQFQCFQYCATLHLHLLIHLFYKPLPQLDRSEQRLASFHFTLITCLHNAYCFVHYCNSNTVFYRSKSEKSKISYILSYILKFSLITSVRHHTLVSFQVQRVLFLRVQFYFRDYEHVIVINRKTPNVLYY